MKRYYSLIILCFLMSCGANSYQKNTLHSKIEIKKLDEKDLFTFVKVDAYLKQINVKSVAYNHLFLKGIDSYKNKKQLDSAAYYFTQSILSFPTNMAYFELGNVYLDAKKYKESISAYEMAERLGYEPFSKVLYNISCVHSLLGEPKLAGNYLEYALQAGYSNIENINTDSDLSKLRENKYIFEYHLDRGLKGLSNSENLFWLQFKRQFSKTTFPLKVDENLDMLLLNDDTRISYDFEKYISEMRDEKFSREVSKGFYYLAQLGENEKFVALIYLVKEEFFGNEAPLTFRLATFSNNGKLIDKKEIGGRSDLSAPLKTAIINSDLSVKISSYETEFKNNPEEKGYYDNPVVKKTKLIEEYFKVNELGKIVADKAPVLANKSSK